MRKHILKAFTITVDANLLFSFIYLIFVLLYRISFCVLPEYTGNVDMIILKDILYCGYDITHQLLSNYIFYLGLALITLSVISLVLRPSKEEKEIIINQTQYRLNTWVKRLDKTFAYALTFLLCFWVLVSLLNLLPDGLSILFFVPLYPIGIIIILIVPALIYLSALGTLLMRLYIKIASSISCEKQRTYFNLSLFTLAISLQIYAYLQFQLLH